MRYFSSSYDEARSRFLVAARDSGALVDTHFTDRADKLAIDIAIMEQKGLAGSEYRNLVISSGLHGVEGYFGSAVQLALLDHFKHHKLPQQIRLVLIHAMNPYGFKYDRRFDQNNVDLNRNFHHVDDLYTGAPAGYTSLYEFLNPASTPAMFEMYRLRALWNILKHGTPALKEAIVGGQYQYPAGIFYGGAGASETTNIIINHSNHWIGDSEMTVHIDLHSGLGAFATHKLLVNEIHDSDNWRWYVDTFGGENLETQNVGTAYKITGSFGDWMQQHFRNRRYYFLGAEFGTYGPIRVLGAIRAENRAHHYMSANTKQYIAAKQELKECFLPTSNKWKMAVINDSIGIVSKAVEGLLV